MSNVLNLPNAEQFDAMNEFLEKIANSRVQEDFSTSPGSKFILKGDKDAGFYGFVQAAEFITGADLSTALGITSGTLQNSDTQWIKYSWKGKVCFAPLKTIRYNIPWDAIYNAGAVHGDNSIGALPPEGRLGSELEIVNATTITTTGHFLGDKTSGTDYYDTVGAAGDTITLAGWTNGANNGNFTIDTISDGTITVVEGGLVAENGSRLQKLYPTANAVTQNATVEIGGLTYRARLMRGAANDPLDSYANSDRDGIGDENEWNGIILPLHERAKLQNWKYPAFVGTTEYFGIDLSDEDLRTHHDFGNGSYSWCQEVRDDDQTFRRVSRGYNGASYLGADGSWYVYSHYGFRPVLELLG